MSSIPTLPGITSQMIETPRLRTHALFSGAGSGIGRAIAEAFAKAGARVLVHDLVPELWLYIA